VPVRSRTARFILALIAVPVVVALVALVVVPMARRLGGWGSSHSRCAGSTDPTGWAADLTAAAQTGAAHGLRVGVAVVDTSTGACYTAGDTGGEFATASVVKVMIAAYLLDTGRMTGAVADQAYSMITRSDDDAADVLWGQVGADRLEPWIERHYWIAGLGSANSPAGRWGNTHVTASGLVRLYAALKADPAVWPWLGNALHHLEPIARDGTDQRFGLPAVVADAAVKQGWAGGSADDPRDAVVNSTGFASHDRYAVAILTEGHDNVGADDAHGFNADQAATVTMLARQLELTSHG